MNCTSRDDLMFRQQKITPKVYATMVLELQPYSVDFIKSIRVVHRRRQRFVVKSLEMICENIDEAKFREFVHEMKDLGFSSKRTIQFVDSSNHVVYHDHFETGARMIIPKPRTKKPKDSRPVYSHDYLYKLNT